MSEELPQSEVPQHDGPKQVDGVKKPSLVDELIIDEAVCNKTPEQLDPQWKEKVATAKALAKKNEKGQFIKGTGGGPGSPFQRTRKQFERVIRKCTNREEMMEIWATVKKEAIAGNFNYSKLAMAYLVGEPVKQVEATILQLKPEDVQMKIDEIFGVVLDAADINDADVIDVTPIQKPTEPPVPPVEEKK